MFEILPANGGGYFWTLKGDNGETLCHSEVYTTKRAAQKGIRAVQSMGAKVATEQILWIVGQKRGTTNDGEAWDFQGVFDSEEKAKAACRDANYFIGPSPLNTALPGEAELWPGLYYPATGILAS